jgi:hypothetical protein
MPIARLREEEMCLNSASTVLHRDRLARTKLLLKEYVEGTGNLKWTAVRLL